MTRTAAGDIRRLFVDSRWTGHHGIARFGQEVTSRLALHFTKLTSDIQPNSRFDILNPMRLRLRTADVIYSPGFNAGVSLARQVLTLHDLIHLEIAHESSALKRAYYEFVVKPVIKRSGLVFTVSKTSQERITSWLGTSNVQVVNVGNGVSKEFCLDSDGAALDAKRFLFVGNLKPHKNLDVLLRALRLRPQYSLDIVGSDEQQIRARAYELGVADQIFVTSGISDGSLAQKYRTAAALLFPSVLEGFGLPAVEAIRCGSRVAFWAGCNAVAEIAADYGVAVSTSNDAEQWAAAMDTCSLAVADGPIEPSDDWKALYDWDNVAANVSRSLQELCNTSKR